MKSEFSADFFIGNRAKLRALFTGTAPIVITSNSLLQRSTSMTYPFHQDGNFWYLTGIDVPNVVLVMDKNREYLIAPELSKYQEIFDGGVSGQQLTEQSGISEVLSGKEGWQVLSARLKKVKHVATMAAPPAFVKTYGMFTNPARASLIRKLKESKSDIELLDLSQHLQHMRMVKKLPEIVTISKAITATISGIEYVEQKYRAQKYSHENDIDLDLSRQFWKKGARRHSFDSVIASGERGLVLHISDKASMNPAEQLLVDVGAEYDHYAADISRTWMIEPTRRFETVHQAVCEVADYAMEQLMPGVILSDYEKLVENYMGEKLRELGLIKIIEHDLVRQFFPHSTSHYLGIDVHDVGDYSKPLEPGVVLTVEPGIYISDEKIGIRIEDDILITDDGCTNLSSSLKR